MPDVPSDTRVPRRRTLHLRNTAVRSSRTARTHTDNSRSNRKHKPVGRPHTPDRLRLQFPLELAPANTQTAPSESPAAPHISDNAYSPPASGTSSLPTRRSLKLSNLSTYWNRNRGKKFRKSEWLISTIPLKFNHLHGCPRSLAVSLQTGFPRSYKLKLPRTQLAKNALMFVEVSSFPQRVGPQWKS